MKKGKLVKIEIPNNCQDSETLSAEFIGCGQFAMCYRVGESVYAYVQDAGEQKKSDLSKEAVALYTDKSNRHIPEIDVVGDYEKSWNNYGLVYRMPFYTMLDSSYADAWKQFRILEDIRSNRINELRKSSAYEVNESILADAEESDLPESIVSALRSIHEACSNYSQSYLFEFAKRNLAVHEDGTLILLDVIFNADAI